MTRTQDFYEKHGGKALIYAKFVPIIRTFAPFMAGVGKMHYPRFLAFNVIGGLLWVLIATLAGYYLGQIPLIRQNFEKALLGVIFISILPLILQVFKARRPAV